MSAILGTVVSALLNWATGLIASWLGKRADQAVGADAQASKETAVAQKVTAAEAQAEATAPTTIEEVAERASKGTF